MGFCVANGCPHDKQNCASEAFFKPHFAQILIFMSPYFTHAALAKNNGQNKNRLIYTIYMYINNHIYLVAQMKQSQKPVLAEPSSNDVL
jgi:hypothetical protein